MGVKVLQPEEKLWTIDGVQYAQVPFGLDRISTLFGMAGGLLTDMDEKEITRLMQLDTAKPGDMIFAVGMLMKKSKTLIPEFVSLCLDLTDEADIERIKKHCSLSLGMKIISEFLKQNDIKGLQNDFLELEKSFKVATS